MTKLKIKILSIIALAIANLLLLAFLVTTNRITYDDEGRGLSAGVSHWLDGEFGLANDMPPLARMAAVTPLLPLGVKAESTRPDGDEPAVRLDRELRYAGRFAHVNLAFFEYLCLARATGFLWWLLGALLIFRWSGRLYGGAAGCLAVLVWSVLPNVLAHEQLLTPGLPAAVACAVATYAFRDYLLRPSWENACVTGFLLGVAQLVEFASLLLMIAWPMLALAHRATVGGEGAAGLTPRARLLQLTLLAAICVWVINVGYGFRGSGTPLGRLDFASRAFTRGGRPSGESPDAGALVNRFDGTWPGRLIVPLPAAYLEGLDRRLAESSVGPGRRTREEGDGANSPRSDSPTTGMGVPLGVWVMALWSLSLSFKQRHGGTRGFEELTLWLCGGTGLVLSTCATIPVGPEVFILLATPYAVVVASQLASIVTPPRGKAGWAAAALIGWALISCLYSINQAYFTPYRTTLLRQDLVRQGRKLGLAVPDWRTSVGAGAEERGLFYRTFVDSRGVGINYALFVPKGYRGDRPYPLILFLHGWGDRGTNGRKFTEVGLPFTLKFREIDFLVLCPQGRIGRWDADGDDARRAIELLGAVQAEYRVDPKRISLAGVSSGGAGVWNLAARYPDVWAAIVPVAGSCNPALARAVKHIPCWCFHNRYDGDAPVENPREMIESMKALGGQPRYVEYPSIGHRAWERAYVSPDLYRWLSQQRLP